jgi:7-keto-8-aminopelargonate synthetase-like enzyme
VSFANYDYLGVSGEPKVLAAAEAAMKTLGVGALASRAIGGERRMHRLFEKDLACFLGVGDVLTIVSGYLANSTTIAHLMDSRDAIVIDDLSHSSLFAGTKGSPATTLTFRHGDMRHLESLLKAEREKYKNVLIIAEGLYSMDGDIVDLPALVSVKQRFEAWLMIDEAHSIGVLGRTGRGICEHWGVNPERVDLIIGTLSKTFASCGGFIAGQGSVIEWLRYTLPGFVYSVGLSPVITAAAHEALRILERDPSRLDGLRHNSSLFLDLARGADLDVGKCVGIAIIPVILKSNEEAMSVSDAMLERGFFVPPIIATGVPKEMPRLRFFISAAHQPEEIRQAVHNLADILSNYRAVSTKG